MKITSLEFKKNHPLGLGEFKLKRLNKLVLLAGKNGSGKTRVIDCIGFKEPRIEQQSNNISKISTDFQIAEVSNAGSSALDRNLILELRFKTPNDNVFEHAVTTLERNYQDAQEIKFKELHLSLFYFIEKIFNTYLLVKNPEANATPKEIATAKDNFDTLVTLTNELLGTKFKINSVGKVQIYGKDLNKAQLSEGQKSILYFIANIIMRGTKIRDKIITIDEPENHLHPKMAVNLVRKMADLVPEGQVWVTTHSVNIISEFFNEASVWYMDEGKAFFTGNKPEQILEGLVGDEEQRSRLRELLNLPSTMASNQFAIQSLFEPQVISVGGGDPQVAQLVKILTEKMSRGEKISLLDYGAGKGRLLSGISEHEGITNELLTGVLNYIAYDKFEPDKEECCSTIEENYGTSEFKYFKTEDDLKSRIDPKSLDYVIMCNVFHEIPPQEWKTLFSRGSAIIHALKDSGELIIIEDQVIPVGEKAHKEGFLVFDRTQFCKLFSIDPSAADYKTEMSPLNDRLKAHRIPKSHLENISSDTIKNALESLKHKAKEEITSIRTKDPSYKAGLAHGFWIQQFANSSLSLL